MTAKRRLSALILAVLLTACGGPSPDAGTVTGHKYDDPDTWIVMTCVSYNAKGICMVWVPIEQHDRPHWALYLRPTEGEAGWRGVTQREFDHCQTDESYPDCGLT